jgi:hypothetical protein
MGAAADAAPAVTLAGISPDPDDEEVAAILAAIEVAWPRPVAAPEQEEMPRWRFSGRWWRKPVPQRRDRPSTTS